MTACPEVTVLIPAYNAEPYLAEAIDSVLAQDFRDLELLVIDDGSTDRTARIATGYTDPRVEVVRLPHAGVVAAANHGLDRARGRFVARLDADDVMRPGRLAAQVAFLHRRPRVVAVGTDYRLIGAARGRVRMPRSDRACRQRLLLSSCFAHSSVLLRAEALTAHGVRYRSATGGLGEDYALWCELAAHGAFANLPIHGLDYRVHNTQATQVRWAELVDSYCAIAADYARSVSRAPLDRAELVALLAPSDPPVPAFVARAAWHALRRAPGRETARFVTSAALRRWKEAADARLRR
ncbi:glycosyltransferase family A protein [Nocardia sp. NPDC050710]|uniref:glycosyltransferase family 2 protein n=1 Tax=Nocardia sp. NPDC050710 TaxID=3157220 RepID=UPI0033E77602